MIINIDKENVVVAGNGPSLKEIDYSRLPEKFDIFRTTQFYFEDKYYLGGGGGKSLYKPSS